MLLEILSSFAFIVWFTIIALILTIVSLERQKEGVASGFVSLVLGLLLWNYGKEIWEFVSTNVSTTVYFSLGYVIIGVAWSFLKWNEKVKKVFKKYKEIKTKFGDVNTENMKSFIKKLNDEYKYKISFYDSDTFKTISTKITPVGLDNKSLIMSWISYWPLSLLGTLLNNPFRRFFSWVYEKVSGIYDVIGNKHQKDAFGNFELESKKIEINKK